MPPETRAALLELIAAVERLNAADDGSNEKCDAIDALYLNFNYRDIRRALAAPVATAGWQPPPEVPKPKHRDPSIEPWLLSKGFMWDEGKLGVAWSHRSGFDRTSLMFWPHDYGWDAVIGCHASGMNPRLGMGTCYTLAEVQMVCETVRCINGYKHREGYPSEWALPSDPPAEKDQ